MQEKLQEKDNDLELLHGNFQLEKLKNKKAKPTKQNETSTKKKAITKETTSTKRKKDTNDKATTNAKKAKISTSTNNTNKSLASAKKPEKVSCFHVYNYKFKIIPVSFY